MTDKAIKVNKDVINTFILGIFASAIIGLGGSHIYVLNKLAANEVRISRTEEAVRMSDSRYLEILEKVNDTNVKIEKLTTQLEEQNKHRKGN